MALGIGPIGNLLGTVNSNGALLVTLDGGAAVMSLATVTVDALTTTSTDGVIIQDTTAATSGATVQMSPRIRWSGQAWDSDDSVSRPARFIEEVLPVSGTTVTGTWRLGWMDPITNALTYPLLITSGGILTTIDNIVSGSRVYLNGGARSYLVSASNGQLSVSNNGSTASIGVDTGSAANGQVFGLVNTLTELTTIAASPTTDTTIQMPANSVVLAVSVRVTVAIPTATTFTVGDSGSAARFSTAAVSVNLNSTDPGTKAAAYYNASALSIRITPNGTPANNNGRVRVTIYYYTVTPPTS